MPYLFSLLDTYEKENIKGNSTNMHMFELPYYGKDGKRVRNDNLTRCSWRKFPVGTVVSEFVPNTGGGKWSIETFGSNTLGELLTLLNNMYGLKSTSWLGTYIGTDSEKFRLHTKSSNFLCSQKAYPIYINSDKNPIENTMKTKYGVDVEKMNVFDFVDFGSIVFDISSVGESKTGTNDPIRFKGTSRSKFSAKDTSPMYTYGFVKTRRAIRMTLRHRPFGGIPRKSNVGFNGPSVVVVGDNYVGAYIYAHLNIPKFALTLSLSDCSSMLEKYVGKGLMAFWDNDDPLAFKYDDTYSY